ncbi:MAG: manganese efflux pump [Solirubrobacteraceae bacterium]
MLTLLLVAASVGLDNFAAAIAIGISGVDQRLRLWIALVFGLFETGMPILGLLAGRGLAGSLGAGAHVLGGLLLIAAGAQMGFSSVRGGEEESSTLAGVGVGRLLVLAAGLSIDNLVIGFALGAQSASIVFAVVVIGVVSVGLSLVGLELGSRLGESVGRRSELLGAAGLVLVGTALALGVL